MIEISKSKTPLGVPAAWTGANSLRIYRPEQVDRLDRLVANQATRTPDAPALREGVTVVTYAELMSRARRLACRLRTRGITRGNLVAVCVDRSIAQIVSVLGILVAGAACVPIDPDGPDERRRFMLDDAQPRAIVTTAARAGAVPPAFRERVVAAEPDEVADATHGPEQVPLVGTPRDLAYVIYTSGSTGTPKGVLNQHDGVSNHLAWMADTFPLSPGDRVLGKTPAVFDVSVWEWFWPLSQGACLVLARPGGEKDPACLIDAIESEGITNIHFVPTLLGVLLDRPDLDRCRSLRRVVCSGEALTAELRDRFFARMPGRPALIDLYGPTETAVHVTGWVCTPGDTGPVPIGRPLANVRAYIVDEALNPVPVGVPGELLIGGVQVARGYLNRPELTRERFVADPFADDPAARCYRTGDRVAWRPDGAIDFFGRYDSQVQIGGVRVELGEIEAALRRHPAVADAAVVMREADTPARLIAYLRRGAGADPSVDSLRRVLADTLPEFMLPSRYVWLDEFPVTPTGKLDRRALPAPESVRLALEQAFEAPLAGIEMRLARIWCDELRIDRAGRHDDFHLLGGDSLNALRMFEAVTKEFGIELPPSELLHSPTIARLATRLDAGEAPRPATTSIVTLRAGSGRDPLYLPPSMGGELFFWRYLVQALPPDRPIHGFVVPDDAGRPPNLEALASVLVRDLVAFQPEGPYHVAGYSFSAALALEMAQQLRASGRTVGVLAMIDYGPGLPDGWRTRLRTVGYFLQNLPQWLRYDILQAEWASLARRVWLKLASIGERMGSIGRAGTTQTAERSVAEMFDHQELPDAYRRIAVDYLDAFYRYEPAIYDGQVLLFWARCRPLFHSLAPALGWNHFAADGFKRIVVPCNHGNIMMSPHVGAIAAGLERAIGHGSARRG